MFPEASVALQLTVVVPLGKVEPFGGVQLTVAPGQLSDAMELGKVTTASHLLRSVGLV
jgi:hypothetical protein